MIRLNIKKDSKVEVKSFVNKSDLIIYLNNFFIFSKHEVVDVMKNTKKISSLKKNIIKLSDNIWDLNVGTALTYNNYTIAMAGKSRAGNIMLGGK